MLQFVRHESVVSVQRAFTSHDSAQGASFHTVTVLINVISETLDIQNVVRSIVMIKVILLLSQATALHSIVFTAFVKGGNSRRGLPLHFHQNILGIYLELTRRFTDGIVTTCLNTSFAISEVIAIFFKLYFGI